VNRAQRTALLSADRYLAAAECCQREADDNGRLLASRLLACSLRDGHLAAARAILGALLAAGGFSPAEVTP